MTASTSPHGAYQPADLLLHRDSMLLISRVLNVDATSSEVEIDIGENSSFFVPGKGVPGWIGIEYMSQSAAVIAGFQGHNQHHKVPQGYLLGTRRYACEVAFFAPGSCLRVSCREEAFHDNGLGIYHAVIATATRLAECRLNIFRKPIERATTSPGRSI